MVKLAIIFLVIELIAALFGFGGVAGATTNIVQLLFFVFLVIFVASPVLGMVRR